MQTRTEEIADRIFRISTAIPAEVIPPRGFTFNQFLIDAEEPLLYHTGMRQLFPAVSEAVARVVPLEQLRWIAFSHIEADECGAMNLFLAACPEAQVVHGALGVDLSIADMADREPKAWAEGEVLDIGGRALRRRLRQLDTPHVPHNWEAQVLFEEETATLLCGDLGTQLGDPPALTEDDIVEGALEAEAAYRQTSSLTALVSTLRTLAELRPRTLAIMHGASYRGDGAWMLKRLAAAYEERFSPEVAFATDRGKIAGGEMR